MGKHGLECRLVDQLATLGKAAADCQRSMKMKRLASA